jgi:hypothetical protein
MNHTIEIGSGTMTYKSTFIKTGSGIQNLLRRGHTYRDTDSKVIS